MTLLDLLHVETHGRDGAACVSKTTSPSKQKAILDSEFATLQHWSVRRIACTLEAQLTDSTLSSDVLPAFWRPIIVTSISVALHETHTCQSLWPRPDAALVGSCSVAARWMAAEASGLGLAARRLGHSRDSSACWATSSRGKEMKHTKTSAVTNHRDAERGRPWCRTSLVGCCWLTMRWQSLCEVGAADGSRATLG